VIGAEELANLWRKHGASLALLCRLRCSSPEDCVQEAFIRLAREVPVPDDPVAWLARVARNEALSRWRSEQRRRQREQLAAAERPTWFLEPRLAGDDSLSSSAEVQAALQQLEESTREIVVAHLWGGLTFRQVAEAFELSSSAAHRQYAAGLAQLKQLLTQPAIESINRV
jgi:RNA polymerase sigma factor (sigma-70 family)